jgi:hypothetical protein
LQRARDGLVDTHVEGEVVWGCGVEVDEVLGDGAAGSDASYGDVAVNC